MRRRSAKRRFGVSIPEDLAKHLDILVERLGTNRSKIICEALEKYIYDYLHYMSSRQCCGIIAITGLVSSGELMRIIEENRDIVYDYSHTHAGGVCVNTIIVSGPSSKITELHKKLLSLPKCGVKYIPIGADFQ